MKIAVCVPSWPPGSAPSGIVTYASELVPALRAQGHEVFVLAGYAPADLSNSYTIDVRRFARAPSIIDRVLLKFAPDVGNFRLSTSKIVSAVRSLLREHTLDVVEIEESFGWSSGLSRSRRLPVVVRLHGPWFVNKQFH